MNSMLHKGFFHRMHRGDDGSYKNFPTQTTFYSGQHRQYMSRADRIRFCRSCEIFQPYHSAEGIGVLYRHGGSLSLPHVSEIAPGTHDRDQCELYGYEKEISQSHNQQNQWHSFAYDVYIS